MGLEELRRLHRDCVRVMLDYQHFRFTHPPSCDEPTATDGIGAMLATENARITRRLEKVVYVLLQARQRAGKGPRPDRFPVPRNSIPLAAASEQDRNNDDLPEEIDRLLSLSEELVRRVDALADQTG